MWPMAVEYQDAGKACCDTHDDHGERAPVDVEALDQQGKDAANPGHGGAAPNGRVPNHGREELS